MKNSEPGSQLIDRIDKDSKEKRNKRIFDLWLSCWTQEEIAEECGCGQKTVDDFLAENADLRKALKSEQAAAEHARPSCI